MSVSNAITVGMNGCKELLSTVSSSTMVCVRGRHAIGKSEGVYQAARNRRSDFYKDPENCRRMVEALGDPAHGGVKYAGPDGNDYWTKEWTYELGLPVVERRLSQMTEGDLIGLPYESKVCGQRATQYVPCDWLIEACHFPVVLFLDERNRALDAVKQSIFQLADSRAFYGNRLHPETLAVVSENIGEAYQVQQQDPAEISRWVTVNLEPSREEFFAYADRFLHEAVLDFLRTNPPALEYVGVYEPDKKYPDRRAWVKFNKECSKLGLLDEDTPPMLLRVLAGGYLGVETGVQFFKFCQERERQIKAEDVLKDWKKTKNRLSRGGPISAEKYVEIIHKLGDYLKSGTEENPRILTNEQADEYGKFMHDCPAEPRMAAWALLQRTTQNLYLVHPKIMKLMVATATGADTSALRAEHEDVPDTDEPTTPAVATPTKANKRGRK